MTANDIINSWKACQPVFQNPNGWLTLLTIAAAGEAGITRRQMLGERSRRALISGQTTKQWQAAGLIEVWTEIGERSQPTTHMRATDKAYRLLRIQ